MWKTCVIKKFKKFLQKMDIEINVRYITGICKLPVLFVTLENIVIHCWFSKKNKIFSLYLAYLGKYCYPLACISIFYPTAFQAVKRSF